MSDHGKALVITALLLAALTVVGWGAYSLSRPKPADLRPRANYLTTAPPVLPTDPTMGPATAKVTIIAFMDLGCGPCARAMTILQDVHQRMPEVRIVWKDVPEHGESIPGFMTAHIGARCADRSGKFWDYAAEFFSRQDEVHTFNHAALATQLGLPLDAFNKCLTSEGASAAIQTNILQARERGIFSTPYFFINNRRVDGVVPTATMLKYIIDERRK
ncbi:MAG: thioredoxin domain-containing protein [Patescibacteria group bacterium]